MYCSRKYQPTTIVMSVLNKYRIILSPVEYSFLGGKNVDFHMYHTVNMAVVNYFGTQTPDIKKIVRQMKIELGSESADFQEKDLAESEDHFIVTDVLLSENPVILTIKDLQVESYENEEVLIEYILANPMLFKDVVDCIDNNEKVII